MSDFILTFEQQSVLASLAQGCTISAAAAAAANHRNTLVKAPPPAPHPPVAPDDAPDETDAEFDHRTASQSTNRNIEFLTRMSANCVQPDQDETEVEYHAQFCTTHFANWLRSFEMLLCASRALARTRSFWLRSDNYPTHNQ